MFRHKALLESAARLRPGCLASVPCGRGNLVLALRQTADGAYAILESIGDASRIVAVLTDATRARAYLHTRTVEG